MSSTAIATMVKMMESLPEDLQNQIVEHLREYIEDLRDEMQWDATFQKTQHKLVAAARQAKQEIAEGKAAPLDYDQL
ncbi:hypothetical protein WA1_03800 [Scytonema hofmannii PCC 7110]|uniref:DUF2281 domain-containing protein n=1 Tax=Scytonema hofmannii PCC 7110 TaxID=128403 RepID=A0A139X952_9CYAN|nr:hypothetical protein [Scytonema hofmannii]KYC41219.1 hypothetical protein WA1_03800 [Scytonema hofmannii PCC 7110]